MSRSQRHRGEYIKNPYDSEEYIKTVMRMERCDREGALKLIEEFKAIDAQKGRIINGMDDTQRMKMYRERWRKEGRCTCCGKQDDRTKNFHYSTCERCFNKQLEYRKRKKEEKNNGTDKQNPRLHEEAS